MRNHPSKRMLFPLLALIAALALILSGCGGEDGAADGGSTADAGEATVAVEGEAGDQLDADADAGGEPLADDDFVAAVTDVCERVNAEIEKVDLFGADYEADPTQDEQAFAAEFGERWQEVEGHFAGALDELRQISPPESLNTDYEEFVTLHSRMLELNSETMAAYVENPEFTMTEEAAQEQEQLGRKADRLIKRLGLEDGCFGEGAV